MKPNHFYAISDKGTKYELEQLDMGSSIMLTLKKETLFGAGVKQIRLLPELGEAMAGDDGYYIIPRRNKTYGDIQTFFRKREDTTFIQNGPVLAWYGIKKKDFTCIVRLERSYLFNIEAVVNNGQYTICALYDFTDNDMPYEDIRAEVIFLPDNAEYADMARADRETRLMRGEIRTLIEKCKSPAVEYLRNHPLVRIRMGWKPSPSPVLHQTEENEPDMFVACDFARVRDIADEMKRQGVEGVDLQLVGWNRSGHDGRWPQLFPADPRLGGNKELKKTVDYVKSLGYRISTHTIAVDAYEIADTFTWDDIVVKRDGEYMQRGHYSAGYAYHICPIKQYKNAMRDLPPLRAYGENGVHYVDVISVEPPDYCHSKDHPSSTKNSYLYVEKTMEYTRGLFGGLSSEGCMDFAMKHLDFGLYATFGNGFGTITLPLADRYLPIFELEYHGIVLYNPTATTVNYTIQPASERLLFIMRGGTPAMYFHSKFRTGGQKDWMGENDLTCESEEAIKRSVSYVKAAEEEQKLFADHQTVYMKNYEIRDDGIHIATYEDGFTIVGNFNDCEMEYEGSKLSPWGYKIT